MTPFTYTSRVGWRHLDPGGVLHFASIFRFFEAAEFEFFRSLGFDPVSLHPGLPRVHCEADYLGPMRHDDVIDTAVEVAEVGRTSFALAYTCRCEGAEVARGRSVIVQIEPDNGRPLPLTEGLEVAEPLRKYREQTTREM